MKQNNIIAILVFFGIGIFLSAYFFYLYSSFEEIDSNLLQSKQERESVKSMDCEQLEQYVLDDREHWEFARNHYDLRCVVDSHQKNQVDENTKEKGI